MAVWQNPERKVWEPPKEEEKANPFPLKPGESFNFKENGSGYNPNPEIPYSPKGTQAIVNDFNEMMHNAGPEALQVLGNLFKGGNEAVHQATTNPLRTTANIGLAGPLEMMKQGYNLGPRALSYLGEKGLIPQNLGYGAERAKIGETGLKKLLFGEPQPGDEFLEGMAPFVAFKQPLSSAPIKTMGAITTLQEGNPVSGMALAGLGKSAGKAYEFGKNEISARSNLKELEKQLPTYDKDLETSNKQIEQAQEQLTEANKLQDEATSHFPDEYQRLQDEKFRLQEEGIEANQQTFEQKQAIAQQELAQEQEAFSKKQEHAKKQQEAQQKLLEAQEETGHASSRTLNNKIKSNQKELEDLNKKIAIAPDVSDLPKAEEILSKSENELIEAQKNLSANEEQLNSLEHLGKGAAHNVRVAKLIYEPQKAVEEGISREYNSIEEASKDYEIPIKENADLIQLEKDLREIAPNATEESFQKLLADSAKQLNVSADKTVPAKEYLQKWRSTRNVGYELIEQGNEKGGDSTVEGKALRSAGQNALAEANKMLDVYKQHVPKEVFDRLMAANKEWAEKVIPVKRNATWRAIERNKKIPGKDLIETFLGDKEGNSIMQGHILNSPEASALMLGSRMSGKPGIWNEFHEASIPYLGKISPKTVELLKQHSNLSENIPKIKETIKQSQDIVKKLAPERESILKNEQKVQNLLSDLEIQKAHLEELKQAEKQARAAKKAPNIENRDFSQEKNKIEYESKQRKLSRSKQMQGIEKEKLTLKQVEERHKAEVASKKEALQIEKEKRKEIERLDKERSEKIKEAEKKIKITKSRLMKAGLATALGVSGKAVLKALFTP